MQVRKQYRRIKRFAYLGAFTGTVITVRRVRARRLAGPDLGPPAAWPPLQRATEEPVAAVGDLARAAVANGPTALDDCADLAEVAGAWVAPLADGSCPASHPIKTTASSRIFHEPGGRFYDRTRAGRCYVDPAAAAADGYRPAKGANGREENP